jgi:DnaJ domain
MNSTTRKPRAFAPDPDAPGQTCGIPGCAQLGEYRAPKSRSGGREFHWFCLEHVREFNASWDYYKGMSPDEIEAQLRADTAWQRPSWPLGRLGQTARMDEALEQELHAFAFGPRATPAPAPNVPAELRDALGVLGLLWPVTLAAVKAKYKELAKRHHPDANNGDKGSEEMLKAINLAYATLRGKLAPTPVRASPTAAE